jgi:hypothetical protein
VGLLPDAHALIARTPGTECPKSVTVPSTRADRDEASPHGLERVAVRDVQRDLRRSLLAIIDEER